MTLTTVIDGMRALVLDTIEHMITSIAEVVFIMCLFLLANVRR